jgi:hypothetical protein
MLDHQPPAPAAGPAALNPLAAANDAFRRALGDTPDHPGKMLFTAGLSEQPVPFVFAVLKTIRDATDFPEGDDPYGEHDFGAIEHEGVKVFWKIDYYADAECEHGAETPAQGCYRVLTVMLADEY